MITVDLSFSDTGVCVASSSGQEFKIIETLNIKSNAFHGGFDGMELASLEVKRIYQHLLQVLHQYEDYIFIVEMPYKSQSADAAMCIGMLWGMIRQFKMPILINPSFIKAWSESKPGDKKEKVLEKVSQRWKPNTSNDNIIDAVAIAMACHDLIRTIYHEEHTSHPKTNNSESFCLEG